MDLFSRVIAVCLTACFVIMLPAYFIQRLEQNSNREYLRSCVQELYNEIRENEGINPDTYNNLCRIAVLPGKRKQIKLVHNKLVADVYSEHNPSIYWHEQIEYTDGILQDLKNNGFYDVEENESLTIYLIADTLASKETIIYGGTGG